MRDSEKSVVSGMSQNLEGFEKSVVSEVSRVSREIERLRKNLLCQECHRIWKALKKSVVSGVSREFERL